MSWFFFLLFLYDLLTEQLNTIFFAFRTPSKQKSPKEEKDIDIVELLRNVDPKEYEKYARMYGITDYRGLLQAIEMLKKEKEEEQSARSVSGLLLISC